MEYVLECICILCHILVVTWNVEFEDEFDAEFDAEFDEYSDVVKTELPGIGDLCY